jgi:hypothetical protein
MTFDEIQDTIAFHRHEAFDGQDLCADCEAVLTADNDGGGIEIDGGKWLCVDCGTEAP